MTTNTFILKNPLHQGHRGPFKSGYYEISFNGMLEPFYLNLPKVKNMFGISLSELIQTIDEQLTERKRFDPGYPLSYQRKV